MNNLYLISSPAELARHKSEIEKFDAKNLSPDRTESYLDFFCRKRPAVEHVGKISLIHIRGFLAYNAPPYHEYLGNTNYSTIQKELDDAIARNQETVIFVIDSPGGYAQGTQELADAIKAAPVETIAFVEGQACSAAYWLASACAHIIASPSARLGSIGAISTYVDTTRMYQQAGIDVYTYTNQEAKFKALDTPPTAEQTTYMQERINIIGSKFINTIKANRPDINESAFTASVYYSEESQEFGLSDDVMTWQELSQTFPA